MPKQKRKTSRVKRKAKKDNLGLFLLAGFVALISMWFILKDPLPQSAPSLGQEISEKSSSEEKKPDGKKKSSKKKSSRKDERKAVPTQSKVNDEPKESLASARKPKPKAPSAQSKPPVTVTDLHDSITAACAKLGIPEARVTRKKSGSTYTYSIPIDRGNMDLTYANMIFKGSLERGAAKFMGATDTSGKQSLRFQSADKKNSYTLNLFYDSKVYADKQKKRHIAIVIDDFGLVGGSLLDGWLALDKELCFAIFPDEPHTAETADKAHAQGRQTLIHVPMEPLGYPGVNPGKNAIFVHQTPSEIEHLLHRAFKQLPHSRGINNHMGSLATTDEQTMRTVMNTLKKQGMFFLDSRTSNVSVAYATAQKSHIGAYRNDLFLDSPDISQATMDAKIKQIIALSETKSNIIAITHCHSFEKLQYLKKIISRLKGAGFTIVPISEIGQYNVPGIQ